MDEKMQQLIAPNNCTVGDTYHTKVVMADRTQHNVAFYIGTRSGATSDMMTETLRHFISAIASVANGAVECTDGMNLRTDNGVSDHGEARVSLWVKSPGIPVLLPDGMRFIQVNVFTEDTSAQDFIDAVNVHVNTMDGILKTDKITLQPQRSAPPPPKPQGELDKYFPRGDDGKPIPQQPTVQRTDYSAVPPEVIDIGNYDYNQQTQYEVDYIGRTVAINVSGVSRDMEVKKDKSATFECLNVWGYYDGLPSEKHPMYTFRMFAPKPEQKFGDWITFFDSIETGELSEPGKSITRPMRFYYKLSKGKGNNADNVYWNLRKAEYLDGVAPAGQAQQPHVTPPIEQVLPEPDFNAADEIPF